MRQQRMNFKLLALILTGMFALLAVYGGYSVTVYGNRWVSHRGNTRIKEAENVQKGDILDRNGVVLAATSKDERVYQSDADSRKAVVHLLGDTGGNVKNGVESFQASYLLGFETSLMERVAQALRSQTRKGDNVTLTVDSRLSTAAYRAFQSGASGKKGAIVVMNFKTGEVLASVSLPAFDPNTTRQLSVDELLNRATQALYPPGSTFKIVTLYGALQNLPDVMSRTLTCTGALQVQDKIITDYEDAVHGNLTLREAFIKSCNNVFAGMALELGDERLRKAAESFGFNDNFLFRDLVVENSVYPTTGRNQVQIAWSGAGQGDVEATPLHMCMVASAVANGGVMMEPALIKTIVSDGGAKRKEFTARVYRKALPENVVGTVKDAMRAVVTSGTGTGAQVSGLKVLGKTGSAESTLDGQPVTHAWFVGFLDEPDLPYAISVLVEAGDSGGRVAAPIAKQVFQYIKNNYR